MGELKQHQPPMTIDEQIENLKNIGLIVEDEEYAKRILNDISYFRLIKAYSLNLKTNEGRYRENITFKQLVDLYLFNTNLRVYLSIWASLVVSCWLWKVGEILMNNNDKYCLSESVLNMLLGTTTLNVLGIVAIAMYDVFNGKSEDKIE